MRYNAVAFAALGNVYLGTGFDSWVTSDLWEYTPLVGDQEQDLPLQVAFFPNPAQNSLQVKAGPIRQADIKIYDVRGSLVCALANADLGEKLDISSLEKGVYFLSLTAGGNTSVKKFVKG